MIDQIGGRKVLALTVLMLLGVGTVIWKGDVPANFLTLLEFAFGAFVAGNAVEHGAQAYSSVNSSDSPDPTPDTVTPAVHQLLDSAQTTQQGVATLQTTLTTILQRIGMNK